jgi:hypothetical protein
MALFLNKAFIYLLVKLSLNTICKLSLAQAPLHKTAMEPTGTIQWDKMVRAVERQDRPLICMAVKEQLQARRLALQLPQHHKKQRQAILTRLSRSMEHLLAILNNLKTPLLVRMDLLVLTVRLLKI